MNKKSRIFLSLTLVIAAVFLISFSVSAPKKPKKLVIMVADGLGIGQLSAARIANGNKLPIDAYPNMGFVSAEAGDDLSALSTALFCGENTEDGYRAISRKGDSLETLFSLAQKREMKVGMATTGSVTNEFLATLYSHGKETVNHQEQANILAKKPLDAMIGGGMLYFSNRELDIKLTRDLQMQGVKVYNRLKRNPRRMRGDKMAALVGPTGVKPAYQKNEDFLKDAFIALEDFFTTATQGFVAVVHSDHIARASKAANLKYSNQEVLAFTKAAGQAKEYAQTHPDALVVVIGIRDVAAVQAQNEVEQSGRFTNGEISANLCPVFAAGQGSEKFSGIHSPSELHGLFTEYMTE